MKTYQITEKNLVKDYVYGGHGIFTVMTKNTIINNIFIYISKPCEKDLNSILFFDSNMNFLGTLKKKDRFYVHSKKSKFDLNTDIVKNLITLIKEINQIGSFKNIDFFHNGICYHCGEKLINEKTMLHGIGFLCQINSKKILI
jgi:hypothetical protein